MQIILWLEIVGTIAFAISGALVGRQKKMDLFGVAMLGLTTAVGGGVFRDLILGLTPPAAFQQPAFAVIALIVSVAVFFVPDDRATEKARGAYENALLLMDSLGLGLFTVVGVRTALLSSAEANAFLVTFVGVLTGVGGGVLRDMFAGLTPSIFVKHFYASASIIGAWVCALLWSHAGDYAAMAVGACLIVVLRILAAHYRWNLPKGR